MSWWSSGKHKHAPANLCKRVFSHWVQRAAITLIQNSLSWLKKFVIMHNIGYAGPVIEQGVFSKGPNNGSSIGREARHEKRLFQGQNRNVLAVACPGCSHITRDWIACTHGAS